MSDVFIIEVTALAEIKKIIFEFDEVFNPSLKKRVADLTQYCEKLYNNAITLKAVYNKKIIGFASFYCNDTVNRVAYLTQLAVKKDARNKGIGKLLLDEIVKICLSKGMTILKLEVDYNNSSAIKFYEKYGFIDLEGATDKSKYMQKVIGKVM